MPARVRISATQTTIESDAAMDAEMAERFQTRNVIELPDLFGPDVLAILAKLRAAARFEPDTITITGSRLREEPKRMGQMLSLLLNRPALRDWLERITGKGPLTSVIGVVAQFQAGGGQALDWHNDLDRDTTRMLAITVNLGTEPYEGGRFQMKHKKADEMLFEYEHARPGTALVFRIGKDLVHRVTPVTAGGPRTVFGGWFVSLPGPETS